MSTRRAHRAASTGDAHGGARKPGIVQARHGRRQSLSRITTVTFRRDARLRHHPQRHAVERRRACAIANAGSTRRPHRPRRGSPCRVDLHFGELAQPLRQSRQPAIVVYRDRDAHFGRGDDVHGRAVALEHFEQPAQEAVRHQHSRGRDVDDGDVALAGERGDRPVGLQRRLGGDQRAGRLRAAAVEDAHRNVGGNRGQNRARMQNLGAEVGQLGRFAERQVRDDRGIAHDARDRRSACRRRRSRSESRRRRARRR